MTCLTCSMLNQVGIFQKLLMALNCWKWTAAPLHHVPLRHLPHEHCADMLLEHLKKVPWTKNWFRSVEVAVFCAGCALLVPSFDWSSNFLCTMRKSAYMEWYRFMLCSLTICIGPLTSIGLPAHSSWPFGIGHPRPYWYTILKTYTLCGVKKLRLFYTLGVWNYTFRHSMPSTV